MHLTSNTPVISQPPKETASTNYKPFTSDEQDSALLSYLNSIAEDKTGQSIDKYLSDSFDEQDFINGYRANIADLHLLPTDHNDLMSFLFKMMQIAFTSGIKFASESNKQPLPPFISFSSIDAMTD